jgi:hypothetical protein
LPFQPVPQKAGKKGKKNHPSSREIVRSLPQKTVGPGKKHSLLISRPFFPLKRNCDFSASSGSREKNQVNPVNPVRKFFGLISK